MGEESGSLFFPRAVLFDLDDTLIAFDEGAEKTWETVADKFCEEENPPFAASALFEQMKISRAEYWGDPARHKRGREQIYFARREVMRMALAALGYENREASDRAADLYSRIRDESMHLFDGTIDALKILQRQGIRLALVTNGGSLIQRSKLERFGLTPYFDRILIDSEVGVSKPDPGVFRLALREFSLSADEVIMVGDNPEWDIAGAKGVGIFAVWKKNSGKEWPEGVKPRPDYVVQSVLALSREIIRLPRRTPFD